MMGDETLSRNDMEDHQPPHPPNEDDLKNLCEGAKGKQKAGLASASSRLEASRKLIVNAITTSRDVPTLASESKVSSGSGHPGSSSSGITGESSSCKVHQQTLFEQSRRSADESQSELFDTFTQCSTDLLANYAHIDLPEPLFTEVGTSDGLAVVELLSQPEIEPHESISDSRSDFYTPTDDNLSNEAVAMEPIDQEGGERLDFIPNFIGRHELSQQAVPYLGTGDIQETGSAWLEYWNDVFTSYNARVWGTARLMTTLGISAQHRPERDNDDNEPTAINRALGRLRLIYNHLIG